MLHYEIKSPPKTQSIWPVLSLILNSSKKETPCFHRPVSIQINCPLPQGVTQPVSGRSDVALKINAHPKSHILSVQPVILDSSKKETPRFHRPVSILHVLPVIFNSSIKETPVSTDQFQFRWIVYYPRVSLNQFQDDLMLHYKIKALQKLIYDQFCQ